VLRVVVRVPHPLGRGMGALGDQAQVPSLGAPNQSPGKVKGTRPGKVKGAKVMTMTKIGVLAGQIKVELPGKQQFRLLLAVPQGWGQWIPQGWLRQWSCQWMGQRQWSCQWCYHLLGLLRQLVQSGHLSHPHLLSQSGLPLQYHLHLHGSGH